jgi:acetyl/propionyl-CoA carboxylase alpha subunit
MNTRIQVEHPVTEMVTGTDLIEEQILIAQGNELRLKQEELRQNGHAIECRIYAEDPQNNFLPSPGKMSLYIEPSGENIRIDSGIDKATEIHSFFDPMIAKQVVWGNDREAAILKSIHALNNFIVHGIKTNINYLRGIMEHQAFVSNKISTKFCDEHSVEIYEIIDRLKAGIEIKFPVLSYALHNLNLRKILHAENIWEKIGYWRNIMELSFKFGEEMYPLVITQQHGADYVLELKGDTISLHINVLEENRLQFLSSDHFVDAWISTDHKGYGWVTIEGFNFEVSRNDVLNEKVEFLSSGSGSSEKNLFAPMPGKVIKVNVEQGTTVKRGTIMLVVEAMKMENNIIAEQDAVVEKIVVKEGDMVDTDVQLIHLQKSSK